MVITGTQRGKRIFAAFLMIAMLLGVIIPSGMVTSVRADDDLPAMRFSYNDIQYTVWPGQNGYGTGVSWACDEDGNFTITFTQSGTFVVNQGSITDSSVTVIGGGAGGDSGWGGSQNYSTNNDEVALEGHGGNGGGGGELVEQDVSVAEGQSIDVIVGNGGTGGYPSVTASSVPFPWNQLQRYITQGFGTDGEASSFGEITAAGGTHSTGGEGGYAVGTLGGSVESTAAHGGDASKDRDGGGGGSAPYFQESVHNGTGYRTYGGYGTYARNITQCWVCHNYYYTSDVASNLGIPAAGAFESGSYADSAGGSGLSGGGNGGNPCNDCPLCYARVNGVSMTGVNTIIDAGLTTLVGGGSGTANTGGGGGGGAYAGRTFRTGNSNQSSLPDGATTGARTDVILYSGTNSAVAAGMATKGGNGGSGVVKLTGHSESKAGTVQLKKTSANADISSANSCYSLSGAVYALYKNYTDAQEAKYAVKTITTDETGATETITVGIGTYYVKELTAPMGFALSEVIHTIQVNENELTILEVSDIPITDPIDAVVKKTDAATGTGTPSGAATLAGAEFTVQFYAGQYSTVEAAEASGTLQRTWVIRTDSDGEAFLSNDYLVSGDAFYNDGTGVTFPLGTVIVQETKAPEHYTIDGTKHIINITADGTGSASVTAYNAPDVPNRVTMGGVSVTKRDAAHMGSAKSQGDGTLEGAVISILNNNETNVVVNGISCAPGTEVAEMTTDASGYASTSADLLPYGSYKLVEKTAPTGYTVNTDWSAVFDITEDGKIVDCGTFTDNVALVDVSVQKIDAETGSTLPQGLASFEGIEFEVVNASAESIVYDGVEYAVGDVVATITTDADGLAVARDLPYGTYTITEKNVPTENGYFLNAEWVTTVIAHENAESDNCADTPTKGGIQIQKVDAASGTAAASGDSTLQGAVFEIYNASEKKAKKAKREAEGAILYNGETYAVGELITTITTDENGIASIDAVLPIGQYIIREKTPSAGYLLNEDWQAEVNITEGGEIVTVSGAKACPETAISGGVSVQKVDKDTQTHYGNGGIKMVNAEFTIINRSANAVVYNGITVEPYEGDFDRESDSEGGIVTRIYTNEDGFAATGAHDLPYGTYEIIETKAPAGYLVNEEWSQTFTVRENGVITAFDETTNTQCTEEMARLDIRLHKLNGTTGDTLANVVFRVTNKETGEIHIIVTDPNGIYDSSLHTNSNNTNGNDTAVSEDGTVDEPYLNYEYGTWFGGGTATDSFSDGGNVGSFVYGHYHFEELRTSANIGLKLVEFDKFLYVPNSVMDLGDIQDHAQEELETTLIDSESEGHTIVSGAETVTLYDSIILSNLVIGQQYTVEGTVMEKNTGTALTDEAGNPVTAVYTFTATQANMELERKLAFTFSADLLTGSPLVAFEKLTNGAGVEYAVHEDLDDEDQTVYVPGMSTTATAADGTKTVCADESAVIVDTIRYKDFPTGKYFTFTGTLMDKETGEPVKDAQGNEITASKIVKIEQASGTVKIEFVFDAAGLEGKQVVAFEKASRGNVVWASHEDINDESQTVTFPKISTTAGNSFSEKGKTIPAGEGTVIKDRVEYSGFLPNTEYTIAGDVYDADTEEPIIINDKTVHTSTVFTTDETGSGTETVTFVLDTTGMEGRTFVIKEYAYEGADETGKKIAKDDSNPNEAQTVFVPQIHTAASSEAGTHTALPAEETVIYDKVFYTNLHVGQTYVLSGVLIDKETGEVLKNADGSDVATQVVFMPGKANGSITVQFRLDASALVGKSAVAFEELYAKDMEGQYVFLTAHKDIEDEDQTVHFPQISTKAATAEDLQIANGNGAVKITDTVHVSNAAVGSEYVIRGTIIRHSDQEMLKDGDEILSREVTVTAKETEFDADIEFDLDADTYDLKGNIFTVYEKLYEHVDVRSDEADGEKSPEKKEVLVGSHEEIQDEDQTFYIPEISTTAADAAGSKEITPMAYDQELKIIDTVEYKALQPGKTYTLIGTLMNKATGTPIPDTDGSPISASTTFTPEAEDGKTEITFTAKAEYLAGYTAVAYERLTLDNVVIAVHEDIEDESQTVTINGIGKVFKYNGTTGEPVAGAVITITDKADNTSYDVTSGEDGYATIRIIPGHSYEYKEKEAPSGYDLNTDTFSFTVDADGKMSEDASIVNLLTGTVVISKRDATNGASLPNTEITVYKKENNAYTALFSQTTDKFGRIYFYPGEMIGTFYFKETAAPTGYYLDDTMYSFTIHPDLTVTGTTVILNAPSGTVVLNKVDENGGALAGAKYSVYTASGTLVYSGVTDEYGRIYFVSPSAGSYYFIETDAPKGYIKSNLRCEFSIDSDGNITGTTYLANKADDSPKTGDELGTNLWLAGTIASFAMVCVGAATLVIAKKRRKS